MRHVLPFISVSLLPADPNRETLFPVGFTPFCQPAPILLMNVLTYEPFPFLRGRVPSFLLRLLLFSSRSFSGFFGQLVRVVAEQSAPFWKNLLSGGLTQLLAPKARALRRPLSGFEYAR